MYRSTIVIIVFSFVLTSCQKDVPEQITTMQAQNIPAELLPHFERFQEEATAYGIDVNYESTGVTAEIKAINEGSVAGTCTTNGHDLRHIALDQSFWSRASHLTREMVVFHELGHCILGRGHEEGVFQNGICRSIMRSGLSGCQDAYNDKNRNYFIEELFLAIE